MNFGKLQGIQAFYEGHLLFYLWGMSSNGTENRDKKINPRKLLKALLCIHVAESPVIRSFVTYQPPTAFLMAEIESVEKLSLESNRRINHQLF